MISVRAPVAGMTASLRPLAGADELILLEAPRFDIGVAITLLDRVLTWKDGTIQSAEALPITDVDALMLEVRRHVFGDQLSADLVCPRPDCQKRVDFDFSIAAFLSHHAPRSSDDLQDGSEPGWFRIGDAAVEWRVPRASDQLAITALGDAEQALWTRCVRGEDVTEDVRDAVEAAMEALAPDLTEVDADCFECGGEVTFRFDPLEHTLAELRAQAEHLIREVATIARHFHWSEADILALPSARRRKYAGHRHGRSAGVR